MPWHVYNSAGQLLQATDLVDGTVTTGSLATNAVTNAKVADDAIDSAELVAGSVDNAHLADDAVNSDELAAGAVDLAHLSATGTASSSTFLRGDNAWAAPSGGPSQAVQADLQSETNEDTYAPPDLLRHHKGVAKAWAMVAAAGTLNAPSYNIDSITDTGTGNRLVTFLIDFATQQYNVHGLSDSNAGSIYAERTAAGSSRFYTLNNAATPVLQDRYSGMLYFGDH